MFLGKVSFARKGPFGKKEKESEKRKRKSLKIKENMICGLFSAREFGCRDFGYLIWDLRYLILLRFWVSKI
jgi:hypothetical protein